MCLLNGVFFRVRLSPIGLLARFPIRRPEWGSHLWATWQTSLVASCLFIMSAALHHDSLEAWLVPSPESHFSFWTGQMVAVSHLNTEQCYPNLWVRTRRRPCCEKKVFADALGGLAWAFKSGLKYSTLCWFEVVSVVLIYDEMEKGDDFD